MASPFTAFPTFGGPEQGLIILGIRLLALNAFLIFLSLTLRCIANFRDVFKSVTIVCAGLVLPICMYLSTHGSGGCGEGEQTPCDFCGRQNLSQTNHWGLP